VDKQALIRGISGSMRATINGAGVAVVWRMAQRCASSKNFCLGDVVRAASQPAVIRVWRAALSMAAKPILSLASGSANIDGGVPAQNLLAAPRCAFAAKSDLLVRMIRHRQPGISAVDGTIDASRSGGTRWHSDEYVVGLCG